MRVRIHRGASEVGGNCVEVASEDGSRLLLDLGRPLSAEPGAEVALPDVRGLAHADPTLLGLLISHSHLDHYGLATGLGTGLPVYVGEEASRVIDAAAFFSPISASLGPTGFLHHKQPFGLGPFTVTPYLNDHSAFDAYSLLVEADGRRLFYSGDFRGHGRKARLFEELCADSPVGVDVLIMEGTHVRSDASHDLLAPETESELEARFIELARSTTGAVMVCGSAQNLDRLVRVFRAARRSGRTLVVDLYGASVAAATRPSIPQPGFDGLAVYVPNRQRILVKEANEFQRVHQIRSVRVFPEQLAAEPGRFMFHLPSSTVPELIRAGILDASSAVAWSLWEGYLARPSGQRLVALLAQQEIPLVQLHTSGHASVADLRRLVEAFGARCVVPIHSESAERFQELFPTVVRHRDGEWWEV